MEALTALKPLLASTSPSLVTRAEIYSGLTVIYSAFTSPSLVTRLQIDSGLIYLSLGIHVLLACHSRCNYRIQLFLFLAFTSPSLVNGAIFWFQIFFLAFTSPSLARSAEKYSDFNYLILLRTCICYVRTFICVTTCTHLHANRTTDRNTFRH